MAARFHRLKIKSVAAAPADSRLLEFETPPRLAAAYRFMQGQYLTLRAQIDGAEVELVKGGNGVFEISLDGEPVFSKKALGRFPEDDEIEAIAARA